MYIFLNYVYFFELSIFFWIKFCGKIDKILLSIGCTVTIDKTFNPIGKSDKFIELKLLQLIYRYSNDSGR